MRNWMRVSGLFLLFFVSSGFALGSIFNITPSVSSVTVHSNGTTSVSYTVTNTSGLNLTGLMLNLYDKNKSDQVVAAPGSLTLQNDTCSGVAISNGASCMFGVIISGANQAGNFLLTPSVCSNNNQACAGTGTAGAVTVNVINAAKTPYAYFELSPLTSGVGVIGGCNYSLASVNTANTAEIGVPLQGLCFAPHVDAHHITSASLVGELTVSSDGEKVYVLEAPNDTHIPQVADVAVISGGSSPTLIGRILLPGASVASGNFSTVISPDNNTLYVLDSRVPLSSKKVGDVTYAGTIYAINLHTNVVTIMESNLPGNPYSLAISPDGAALYLVNHAGGTDFRGSIAVYDTVTKALLNTIENISGDALTFDGPERAIVSPDNNFLYILNVVTVRSPASRDNPDINGFEIVAMNIVNGSYTKVWSYGSALDSYFEDFVLTSDGSTLYVSNTHTTEITKINTQTFDATPITLQYPNNSGLVLTPDNTALFIAPKSAGNTRAQTLSGLKGAPSSQVLTGFTGIPLTQHGVFLN